MLTSFNSTSMSNTHACCSWMDTHLGRVGESGWAVVARGGAVPSFRLQCRPFDPDVIAKYSGRDGVEQPSWPSLTGPDGRPVPYVTLLSLPLTHCLRCGANLEALIESESAWFEKLVLEHAEYVSL